MQRKIITALDYFPFLLIFFSFVNQNLIYYVYPEKRQIVVLGAGSAAVNLSSTQTGAD